MEGGTGAKRAMAAAGLMPTGARASAGMIVTSGAAPAPAVVGEWAPGVPTTVLAVNCSGAMASFSTAVANGGDVGEEADERGYGERSAPCPARAGWAMAPTEREWDEAEMQGAGAWVLECVRGPMPGPQACFLNVTGGVQCEGDPSVASLACGTTAAAPPSSMAAEGVAGSRQSTRRR